MENKVDKESFEKYLQEARTWETDKVKELKKSRKTAWIVASGAGAITFAAVLAVAALTPLKKTETVIIRVDNSTGIVDVVQTMTDGQTNYDEQVNKYFTQWYVKYREGYSKDLEEDYYYNVGIMSGELEQKKYYDWFNPQNPLSPINIYGSYAKAKIHIKGTSFINPNVALVRYYKEIERGSDKPQITHWAATITFTYSGAAAMKEKDREISPLGFRAIEYRNDPDAVTPEVTMPSKAINTQTPRQGVTVFPGQSNQGIVPKIE